MQLDKQIRKVINDESVKSAKRFVHRLPVQDLVRSQYTNLYF